MTSMDAEFIQFFFVYTFLKHRKTLPCGTMVLMPSCTHPWVIDAGDALLRPVQHQEGCQVGSIRSHNDHGKSGPHHTQDSR